MSDHVEVRGGAYRDSVTLMQVTRAVRTCPGVTAALVAMATDLNLELLAGLGLAAPAGAGPNDLLVGPRKLAGILLERVDAAVVIGVGANLASHPEGTERPATSLVAETSIAVGADLFLADLASGFARLLAQWRDGLSAIRDAWLTAAHPVGTALVTHETTGAPLAGAFDGLEPGGACRLRLADGGVRLIHAGDVFLA